MVPPCLTDEEMDHHKGMGPRPEPEAQPRLRRTLNLSCPKYLR